MGAAQTKPWSGGGCLLQIQVEDKVYGVHPEALYGVGRRGKEDEDGGSLVWVLEVVSLKEVHNICCITSPPKMNLTGMICDEAQC